MSDIPEARRRLEEVRTAFIEESGEGPLTDILQEIIDLMKRKKPTFVAQARYPQLTEDEKRRARGMRENGLGLNEIAGLLGTNIGRVSDAVSGVNYAV